MLTGLVVPILAVLHPAILFILVTISFLGVPKSNLLSHTLAMNLSIVLLPRLLLNFFGFSIFCMISRSLFHSSSYSYVTTKVLLFFFSSNPVSHKWAKYVELDYHFLQEFVIVDKHRTQYCTLPSPSC